MTSRGSTDLPHCYGYARLSRAGLANLLFTWAKCEVFCRDSQIPIIAPQWFRLRLGPLLRRERSTRFYTRVFRNDEYIHGIRRCLILACAKRVKFRDTDLSKLPPHRGLRPTIIEFENVIGLFEQFLSDRNFLKARLHQLLTSSVRSQLEHSEKDFSIGVHIRRGDRGRVLHPGELPPSGSWSWTIPEDWYVRCILNLRNVMGTAKVRVFTDGLASDFPALARMEGVSFAPAQPAIVDLLTLATSKVLIGSASSTFTQWAIFLGGMPSLWFPCGHHKDCTKDLPGYACDTDVHGNFPDEFAALLHHYCPQQAARASLRS